MLLFILNRKFGRYALMIYVKGLGISYLYIINKVMGQAGVKERSGFDKKSTR